MGPPTHSLKLPSLFPAKTLCPQPVSPILIIFLFPHLSGHCQVTLNVLCKLTGYLTHKVKSKKFKAVRTGCACSSQLLISLQRFFFFFNGVECETSMGRWSVGLVLGDKLETGMREAESDSWRLPSH